MPKFKVGDRVKKVRSRYGVNIGMEGTVVEVGVYRPHYREPIQEARDIRVLFDKDWLSWEGGKYPASLASYSFSDEFEPLQPPLSLCEEIVKRDPATLPVGPVREHLNTHMGDILKIKLR